MLNALELAGFKSFAEKTRLEFPAGVTCVVGPNGSGKSNVVDAVKWVLGSQSPKSLRGKEMTDVIFNGSASRRPMNAAEVTLEFDNRQELFDLQEPTVRVTRRVFRSGEGEYAINGVDCRLRDIRELFAGTGAGTQAYSIIEQGRVDAVLQSSPKERRALFEEAAGISRFRLKKQEAARRLARVDQNLLRLSDIVDEVEGRLRRVRSQAGKARRYREQAGRVKDLRTQLGLADWRVLTTQIDTLEQRLSEIEAVYAQHREQLQQGESRQADGSDHTSLVGEQLSTVQNELSTVRERIAACRAIEQTETERLAEHESALTHARRNLVALQSKTNSDVQRDSAIDLRKRLSESKAMLGRAQERAAAAQQAAEKHRKQHSQWRQQLQQSRDEQQQLQQQLDQHRRQIDALATKRELSETQLAEQGAAIASIQQQAEAATNEWREAETHTSRLAKQLAEIEAAQQKNDQQYEACRTQLSQQQQELTKIDLTAAGDKHRLAVLEDAETRLQRLREDMARLLTPPAEDQPAATIRGLVADVLHVDFDTASMIEAALGERAQHLVVDNGEGLMLALARDADALTTRASFQRLDCSIAGTAVDQIDLAGEAGVMGRADQFVETEPEFEALVTRLLGRVWLVDTLATAARLATTTGRGLSFVTFAGELLTAEGRIDLGPQSELGGMLTRRKQIALIQSSLAENSELAEQLRTAIDALQQQCAAVGKQGKRLAAQKTHIAKQLSEQQKRVAALAERHRHRHDQNHQLDEQRRLLHAAVEASQRDFARVLAEKQSCSQAMAPLEMRIAELERQIAEGDVQLQRQQGETTEARVVIARQEQHVEILTGQIQQSRRDASQRTVADEEAFAAVTEAQQRLEACQQRLLYSRGELALLCLSLEEHAAQQRQLSAAKQTEQAQQRLIASTLTKLRRKLESMQTERQQLTLDAERLRLERTTLAQRIREDYDIDLAEAARLASSKESSAEPPSAPRHFTVDEPTVDREALEQELLQLRNEVGAVESVNLESLDELDELESRFAQLSSQYQDLSQAKASLQRLTSRISNDSRQLYLATIEEVRGHFRELFRQLFGGGEADIVLTDDGDSGANGSDPLEAGIDVAASPPGKELRSLSLLSGGERTMTCVALLLAVFRTKPSPFCILDEVDAALDEANIGRFTSVLSEFLSSTQFIVVTHSKKTMTGADTLYGVTMEESGVSKQVAVRFEDVGEDGQINPAATLRRAPPQSRAA